jgi:SAM-dependent methyltransferase
MLEETHRAEQQHFWFRGFRAFVAPMLEAATAGQPHPRILDCGAGTGANIPLLEKYGAAFAIERAWRGLQFAQSHRITRLTQATVAALPFVDASFDATVSFDVLYCLEDPVETAAIGEMFRVLRPGGALVVNVAAMDMLKGDHSILVSEVRRYTRPRLRSKLERAGFRIERITYTNASLFPVAAVVRAWQRLRGLASEGDGCGDFAVLPAPINEMFSQALVLESKLVGSGVNMPFGSSLLCLARKPAAR